MFRAPTPAGLPPLEMMVKELLASPSDVARYLDITPATLTRWRRDGGPRVAQLALFWETRWGRSVADSEAANRGARYYNLAQSLERENAALRRQLLQLEKQLAEGGVGAANTPFWRVGLPEKITIDKSGANTAAVRGLVENSGLHIELRQSKYLNNIVEQDHRAIKCRLRPMLGLKTFNTARRLIAGIETLHMIAKGQMRSPSGQAASAAQQFYSLAF